MARDRALHDRLAAEGERALAAGEMDKLRDVIGDIYANRADPVTPDRDLAELAGLRV